jgi:hypothetical protein
MGEPLSVNMTTKGDIATKAAEDLGEGANQVYLRLRQLERDDVMLSEAAALTAYATTPSVPVMIPPSAFGPNDTAVSATAAVKKTKAPSMLEAKLGADIMAAWASSVHQMGQQRHDLETSPIFRAQESYWREFRNGEHLSSYSTAHSVAGSLMVGATFVAYVGPTGRSERHISYNTVVDANQQITSTIPGSSDMRAELGLLGATFAYGAVFQAAWMTAAEAKPTDPKNKLSLQFATNYADRLIAQTNDPAYHVMLTALITQHLEGAEPPTPEKMQEMIAMVKLGMLLSALALFYQLDTGGQTGIEIAGLLDPKAPALDPNNPRSKLLAQTRQLLQTIKDDDARAMVLEKMMAFLDEKKSVKSLTDPVEILLAIVGGDATVSVGGGPVAA